MENDQAKNISEENDDNEFEEYIERIKKIAVLSSPLIDNMDSPDEYMTDLAENFLEIGVLAGDNRKLISEEISPLLSPDRSLSEEEKLRLKKTGDRLTNIRISDKTEILVTDNNFSLLLCERLLSDIKKSGIIKEYIAALRSITINYMTQYMFYVQIPGIAQRIWKKIFLLCKEAEYYLEKPQFAKLERESREDLFSCISISAYVLGKSFFPLSDDERHFVLDKLDSLLSLENDPFYAEAFDSDFLEKQRIILLQYYILIVDSINCAGFSRDEIAQISKKSEMLKQIFRSEPKYRRYMVYQKEMMDYIFDIVDYLNGSLSKEAFRKKIYERYSNRCKDAYDKNGAIDNIFLAIEYILSLDKDTARENEKDTAVQMYNNLLDYFFRAPNVDVDNSQKLNYSSFIEAFIEFPGRMTLEEVGLKLFAAVHPPTYIHSNMVARISRLLTHYLIGTRPELFNGVCGCPDEEHISEYAERIEEYTYHAALCHDFGKIFILDIISTYGRNLLDDEFNVLKEHPMLGTNLLMKHDSSREYADVAHGHHLWYNCERGYPSDFDAKNSPVKTIIDIVMCADCMDAATDRIGRSYNKGKTLDEYIAEVKDGSGTRYAPYLSELLMVEEVYSGLTELLDKGRKEIYRETYLLLKNVREKVKEGENGND